MFVIPFILAAGSLPALIFGAPLPSFLSNAAAVADNTHSLETREAASAYTVFGGDGSTSAGWPAIDNWVSSFEDMFEANKATMSSSCAQFNVPNNSDDETNDIHDAIKSVSASSGVDARFILAIVMQESQGCVRAPTTNYGVRNPGLMQDHDGTGTCNDGGNVQTPCPTSQINQMIKDGTEGTSGGAGLKQLLASADSKGTDGVQYYTAARMYNSGSVSSNGNLGAGIATHCYASDVANRLIGWATGRTSCSEGVIATLNQAVGSFQSGNTGGSSSSTTTPAAASPAATTTAPPPPPPAVTTAAAAPPPPATTTTAPAQIPATSAAPAVQATNTPAAPPPPASSTSSTTSTSGSDGSSSAPLTGPKYPGAVPNCQAYILVVSGDYCQEVEQDTGVSSSQFLDWNPGLNTACTNLWLGYEYCIKA